MFSVQKSCDDFQASRVVHLHVVREPPAPRPQLHHELRRLLLLQQRIQEGRLRQVRTYNLKCSWRERKGRIETSLKQIRLPSSDIMSGVASIVDALQRVKPTPFGVIEERKRAQGRKGVIASSLS